MSTDALRALKDLENEKSNAKQRSGRTAPRKMCDPELRDLKASIAFHFGSGYVHNENDRIFDKATTTFLRKKYGL
jgi:hypothetical protein